MTQEEKAKAYDDIVNKAESMHKMACGTNCENTRTALENLFPQLAESEDERIRKEIVSFIKSVNHSYLCGTDRRTKWLTWLEKQKEQKPISQEDFDTAKHEALWEEQKPVEKQDYSGLTDFERAIHRGFLYAGLENVPVTIIRETAQECLAQVKPAEWSEEDKKMLEYIINDAIQKVYPVGEELTWLKDLPNRFNLQPKQEWSEEDKKIQEGIMQFLYAWRSDAEIAKWLDWLKSLRPQPKAELTLLDKNIIEAAVVFVEQNDHFNCWRGIDKHTIIKALRSLHPQPSWKPSKEQMKYLEKALFALEGVVGEEMTVRVLDEIRKELKKLMED